MKFSAKLYFELDFSEQPTSADPTSSRSSISPHSEFSSTVFCDHHPSYLLRYFCESAICKIPICEECWENDHKDESHRVILLKIHLESQNNIKNRLAKYKSEFQGVAQFLEEEWENLLKDVENAERKQQDVLRSNSANKLESNSNEARDFLESHWKDVNQFRSDFLSEIDELQKSWEDVLGNNASNNENLESIKKNKQELVRVTKGLPGEDMIYEFSKVVYNSSTNELFCFFPAEEARLKHVTVFCVNETSREIKLKTKFTWKEMRWTGRGYEDRDRLTDVAMDGQNTLYGVIKRENDNKKRLEVLDQNNLAKIGQLDTRGIQNINNWKICAFGNTVVVAVYRAEYNKVREWESVTVFKDQRKQHTVSLNMFFFSGYSYFGRIFLANETTLLLGREDRKIAMVCLSMPGPVCDSSSAPNSSSKLV